MGDVHEITIQGFKLAHKKILFRRKIGEREKKEIEILKRLSHVHMVQLIGTYTQQKFLGIILHPVAVCDLHTFFEDVEEWSNTLAEWKFSVEASLNSLGSSSKARLEALNYGFPTKETPYKASSVYLKIGCLVSAVAYLHDQKIRHKDLKPSNILLSQDRLWLSDFGSATDFTLLSESATDNERGTPRYFAPEMAQWKACGRAADMFSLGCVLLEIITLHRTGTLEHIRQNRSADPSFHANLNNVNTWLNCPNVKLSPRGNLLQRNLRNMLSVDPDHRPTAEELLISLTGNDMKSSYQSKPSIFGICCRGALISHKEHQKQLSAHKQHVRLLQSLLLTSQAEYKKEVSALSDKISALLQRLGDKEAVNKGQSIELEQARTNLQHYQVTSFDTIIGCYEKIKTGE
ncbi:kinase-like domain-containing protein [Pyrenochaeta sp. MPI-SDFR-AT-0127]|nr:kinase-like domain-containing protein [Pyrenochaeta sp. MPI-SDFR-AT-0127]